MASVTFPIHNQWTITSQVELSSFYSEMSQTASIVGRYRNTEYVSFNGILFGNIDNLGSISIDGENPVQGTQEKVNAVLEKVKKAIQFNTGRAMLAGKNLTIETGQ